MKYSPTVSNSHCCPKGGTTNFGGNPDLPRNYMGMSGRIWVRYSVDTPSFASNELPSNVHAGTGGYGSYDGHWQGLYLPYNNVGLKMHYYSWDGKLFAADFLEIRGIAGDARMRGEDLQNVDFNFYWLDKETAKRDEHLLKRYREKCKNTNNFKD